MGAAAQSASRGFPALAAGEVIMPETKTCGTCAGGWRGRGVWVFCQTEASPHYACWRRPAAQPCPCYQQSLALPAIGGGLEEPEEEEEEERC